MTTHFDPNSYGDVISLGLSVIVLGLAFQYVYLPSMVDGLRDRLFNLRRELFLLVVRGEISPTDPEYVNLRDGLNGFIRFAARMTFLRAVALPTAFMMLRDRGVLLEAAVQQRKTVAEGKTSADPGRRRLSVIDERFSKAVAVHLLLSSPIAWLVALLALPVITIVLLAKGQLDTMEDAVVNRVSDRAQREVKLLSAAA